MAGSGFSDAPVQGRRVLGVPGGGMSGDAGWADAKTALHGAAQAERNTAAVLDPIVEASTATILHDLRIPGGSGANIDHIIVAGTRVHLLDTKWWKPGFHWSLGGRAHNGVHRFTPGEKQTMLLARRKIEGYLTAHGIDAAVDATVTVWSSRPRTPVSTWAMSFPGAKIVPGDRLHRWGRKMTRGRKSAADPQVVDALARLLVAPVRPTGHVASGLPADFEW